MATCNKNAHIFSGVSDGLMCRCGETLSYTATDLQHRLACVLPQTGVQPAPLPEREPMLCRATGPDPSTGELFPNCQMPHGHKGECDWAARKLTDDQLRAECSRRGIGHVSEPMVTVERMRSAVAQMQRECNADRDEALKQAHAAERECEHWKTVAESAAAERDTLRARIANAKPYEFLQSRYATEGVERGYGIAATKPDNSAYFDERDLLCDDA